MREKLVCKGALTHGTACGICAKCEIELQSLRSPILPVITEEILNQWEVHASSLDLLAIVKLAKIGLWTERNEGFIVTALTSEMGYQPRGKISGFERALDSMGWRKRA